MKNLFFVSVLFSFFSGTTLSAEAQKRSSGAAVSKEGHSSRPVKFIENIEINQDIPHFSGEQKEIPVRNQKIISAEDTGFIPKICIYKRLQRFCATFNNNRNDILLIQKLHDLPRKICLEIETTVVFSDMNRRCLIVEY